MTDHNNPHAREHELMVRKGVLEQKLSGLRREYAASNSELKACRHEAENLYGTSNPEELMKIAERQKQEYQAWLNEMDKIITEQEALVGNVMSQLEQIKKEG